MSYLNRVAVVESSGNVSITRFSVNDMVRYGYPQTPQGEDDFMAWYMNRIAPGLSFEVISEDNIPKRADGQWDRSERGEWSFNKGAKKVFVDPVKRAAKQAKETERQAILAKMGITQEEFDKIKRVR